MREFINKTRDEYIRDNYPVFQHNKFYSIGKTKIIRRNEDKPDLFDVIDLECPNKVFKPETFSDLVKNNEVYEFDNYFSFLSFTYYGKKENVKKLEALSEKSISKYIFKGEEDLDNIFMIVDKNTDRTVGIFEGYYINNFISPKYTIYEIPDSKWSDIGLYYK